MSTRCYSGEREIAGIDPRNRGLAYGDGLFETMRVHRGRVPLWPRHLARLREGASRLGIALASVDCMEARIAEAIGGCGAGVLKLLLTRGGGGRGYAPAVDSAPAWLLSLHPMPAPPRSGLLLHWCETRLALQPALAGIKHCNRLEQVLARAEVERTGRDEGLMLDMAGIPTCATAANLLVLREGRWSTPRVDACGVAGVLRGWLLEQGLVEIADHAPAAVESANALALCNAVRGILPVAALGARAWAPHPALADLQERLAMAYPMFSEALPDAGMGA
jgi:4-amino-4-deoxychorismate lyase